MARIRGQISTWALLVAFSAALVLPMLGLTILGLYSYAKSERARLEETAIQTARQIAIIIDAEIRNFNSSMDALAATSALQRDDFADFHAQARRYIAGRDEIVILRPFEGKQFANTQIDFGKPVPSGIPLTPSEIAAYQAGKAHVSNVYKSPVSGEPRIAITRALAERPDFLLGITVPTEHFLTAFKSAVPTGWLIGVADRTGHYVTHSTRHEEVTGSPGVASYLENIDGKEGIFYAKNGGGVGLLAGYTRTELTGWTVAANIPSDILEAPLRRVLVLATLGALIVLALMAGFALAFSRRLAAAAGTLAERAEALGEGRRLPSVASSINEFQIIDRALSHASEHVAEREALTLRLARTLREKDLLLREVNHRVKNSLQVVASLLNLQRSQITDLVTLQHFEEAARRINTVAQVHQRLYRDEQPDRVPVHHFLQDLCEELRGTFPERGLNIILEADECFAYTETIIPLAIIVNELSMEALTHRHQTGVPAQIRFSCQKNAQAVVVSIEASGAQAAAAAPANHLGLKIVGALVRQLQAEFETRTLPEGIVFILRIPALSDVEEAMAHA
jgi:two-component sensor histidine kinase